MKVYSNKVLLFVDGGQEFIVKIGFTTAPDWIEKTDLFEAAKKEGALKVVEGSTFSEGEKKLADEEKTAYEAKIAELEKEREAYKISFANLESKLNSREAEKADNLIVPTEIEVENAPVLPVVGEDAEIAKPASKTKK